MGRYSLTVLFIIVLVAAVSCAGVLYFPALWATSAFLGSILVLLASLLAVLYRRGIDRVFWVGFAVFGWSYLLLVFGPWLTVYIGPYLGTSTLLAGLYTWIAPRVQRLGGPTLHDVYRGGHSLIVLVVAYFGGLAACYFAYKKPPSAPARRAGAPVKPQRETVESAEPVGSLED